MNIEESAKFLSAFRIDRARELVERMMIHNYAEAILEHHPECHGLDADKIHLQCSTLCRTIFREIAHIRGDPRLLTPLLNKMARNGPGHSPIWFDAFDSAYEAYKHGGKLKKKAEQLGPYLRGGSYCDIGCGGGDLVAYLKKEHPQFREYAGIDVLDWRTEGLKNEIGFQVLDFSKEGSVSQQRYDLATCIAVLHHVGSTDESRSIFLRNLRSALHDHGRLIIEEDVILPRHEIGTREDLQMQVAGRAQEQFLFGDFAMMTREEQLSVLTIIDVLGNSLVMGVHQMAFPFGFKSIVEWGELFSESGYQVEEIRINGFTAGMFNQSSHVLYILKPD